MQAELSTSPGIARAMAIVASAMEGSRVGLELERGIAASGIPYIVGGWSTEARRDLALCAADFSVTLVFAHRGSCEYVADVNLRLHDERGDEVLHLDEAGPIVLLGLEPGCYEVSVHRVGQTLTRTIAVGARTRRQTVFYWSGTGSGRSRAPAR